MMLLSGRWTLRSLHSGFLLAGALWCGLQGQPRARAALIGTPPSSVTTYRVFELAMSADSPGVNPYLNGPSVTATFTGTSGSASGQVLTMKGFWDGDNVWRVRFAATATGDWAFATSSSDPGLNGITGTVTAVAPPPAEISANALYRGFLQRDGYAWRLSDGTRFLAVGDTQFSFSEEFTTSEWQQWMSARQAQHYNTFHGCIWLAKYDSRAAQPLEPFAGSPPNPQTDSLQVAFFQRLDQMVQYANDRGIMMGLGIGGFPVNSDWWTRFATLARNDRWFKYCVARYSAYNVRWFLYGEVNETNPPFGWGGGITTWQAQVAHDAKLVRDEDPYDHPIGSHHNSIDASSAGSANIDYIEVQIARTETQYQSGLSYRQYGKPVWFEEYWYEPPTYDNDVVLGIRNTHRNFVAALVYPTMGSLMRAHYPDFNISDVGTDPGALRMSYFHEFYKNLDTQNFAPSSALVNTGQCGRFGGAYVIFLQGGGSVALNLTGVSGTFNITRMDINTGVIASLPDITGGGSRTIVSGTSTDVAIRVTPPGFIQNSAPSVNAGADQNLRATATAALNGTTTDDGLPLPPGVVTTQWVLVSGPGSVTFGDATSIDTTATVALPGAYILWLSAYDGELAASDDVTITYNVPGDFDGDFDVDQEDFGLFQLCLSGSGVAQTDQACDGMHMDGDTDVDATDFNLFIGCISGADIPGSLTCAPPS